MPYIINYQLASVYSRNICSFEFFSMMKHIIEHYSDVLTIDEISLQFLYVRYRNTELLLKLIDLKNMNLEFFPNIMKLVNLKNSLSVSTVSFERTFSCVNRINTFKGGKLSDCLLYLSYHIIYIIYISYIMS